MKRNKILFIPLDGSKPRMVDDIPQEEIDRNKAKVMADIQRRKEQRLMNRPTKIDWDRIEAFVGYGNIEAPLVFVGVEEGLAKPEALHEDLLWRSTFKPIMDAKEAHEGIADGPSLFSVKPRRQATWRVMTDVMLRFNGETFRSKADRREQRKAYRPLALGRSVANSLLVELLPYPNKKKAAWRRVGGHFWYTLRLGRHRVGGHYRGGTFCRQQPGLAPNAPDRRAVMAAFAGDAPFAPSQAQ